MAPRGQATLALLLALAWFVMRRSGRAVGGVVELGQTWLERSRQRRQLGELNDYMLRDIGITRAEAWFEADKPFWRP
jgi:uncharacterized protein YjiS (DUF1127 family)